MRKKTVLVLSNTKIESWLEECQQSANAPTFTTLKAYELAELNDIPEEDVLLTILDVKYFEESDVSIVQLINEQTILQEKPVLFILDKGQASHLKTFKSNLKIYDTISKPIDTKLLATKIKMFINIDNNQKEIKTLQNEITTLKKYLSDIDQKLKETERNDYVTGLGNRLGFNEFLNMEIEKAKRYERVFAVMFMDIDNFKSVNDVYGHLAGDKLLKSVAEIIKTCIRGTDFLVRRKTDVNISRFGGDEFSIVLSEIESPENAAIVANRILRALQEPIRLGETIEVVIGMSIGIACYPFAGETLKELSQSADMAMYDAKKIGKNTYCFYSEELGIARNHHIMIEKQIREAIKDNKFYLLYQPIFDLREQKIVALEILCRCGLKSLYGIDTRELIYITEKTGLIHTLGCWVLEQMRLELKGRIYNNYPDIKFHFNVSSKQMRDKTFLAKLKAFRDEGKFDLSRFVLELTETAIHPDAKLLTDSIKEVNFLGIETSIDDFGIGGSSLMWLKYLDIQSLKIDQEFVLDLLDDNNDAVITKSIIQLADSLEIKAIAKGIETKDQLDYLVKHNCKYGQGYYFSRPLRIESLIDYLKE